MPSSIIDNRDTNTLLNSLKIIGQSGKDLCIATAFFSLDALLLLAETLPSYERVRILFGDDAEAKQRVRLLEMLRLRSDEDLLQQREAQPTLSPLKKVEALFAAGKIEARCFTAKKFHAKAYLFQRDVYPQQVGVLGSGNFTRAGLTQNIELNVILTPEQNQQLSQWFEDRWNEARADDVTADVLSEIRRQIDLYAPYVLYLKALFTWGGAQIQDDTATVGGLLQNQLDPHQEIGFRQALRILERQNGVLVCDGVGLGKSFIALALIERFCRLGKRVLLVAPKSILVSSWEGYLEQYLARYRAPFGSLFEQPMTAFGFEADSDDPKANDNAELLTKLAERADVIVIDESHNFRTTSSARYKNLFKIAAPSIASGRKKVVLLTATPINTAYRDLSAQMALVTHDEGDIAGYSIAAIRRAAQQMDLEARGGKDLGFSGAQLSLELLHTNDQTLRAVLESIVIQRSRRTCRELARAAGKDLRFPQRSDPKPVPYNFEGTGTAYREVVSVAERRFRPGVDLYRKLKAAEAEAQEKNKKYDPTRLLQQVKGGIKLAAFLPGQYLFAREERNLKQDRDEIHLAGLVFTNTLKQLESSPAAFQGILQSLGTGLIARLNVVLGEAAESLITPHTDWVRAPLFPQASAPTDNAADETDTLDDIVDDGDALDASGAETEGWLAKAVRERGLARKLAGFTGETHDVTRWANDIVSDLGYLKEIHAAALAARAGQDPKLAEVIKALTCELKKERRILVFTQSRRTAEYLEDALKNAFKDESKNGFKKPGIVRIDSGNTGIRPAVLHAFCPGYNPRPVGVWPYSVPKHIDILISTDVLSEGVNLQETGAILNYDIHWNPVRLIQRIGRVDRRLNPAVTPEVHAFAIYNVLPPDDIENIIDLVGKVENRTLKISRTLGLDVSFFKETDEAGTLKEFNAQYEGDLTASDHAITNYVRLTETEKPDPHTQALLDATPPGAFGVWNGAPHDGLFALFVMEAKRTATEQDRARFASVLGRPVLALTDATGKTLFDAGEILKLLSQTFPGQASGVPSDEGTLATQLKKLRNEVRQGFRDISLPATIAPKLICWMELRK